MNMVQGIYWETLKSNSNSLGEAPQYSINSKGARLIIYVIESFMMVKFYFQKSFAHCTDQVQ